ncbi:hypothetical protein VMCG_08877 [Cytospora schulzeri]|uniref:Enoyl-CoA hydratase domain-containing protein 3, mitochondrial n=1 Tax=Cytospora schulzeri TaxID=448051 RepID=A0A423VUP2_9PEZI|nr:hypothetical protein VMCG_08877 [Valsa malicola]
MAFPKLPAKAAYITLNNPTNRNALSISVLRDLRGQLHKSMTSPRTGKLLTLPPFKKHFVDLYDPPPKPKSILDTDTDTDKNTNPEAWLTDPETWHKDREGLPNALVLRTEGPVFSSGHDLHELHSNTPEQNKQSLALCAEVISLIRHSPAPVICPVQGLATAAGFQLALAADFPIALASTEFQLPGMLLGFPCTGPAVAVSRRLPPGLAYRLFATGERVTAGELGNGVLDVVPVPEHAESTDTAARAFEERVAAVVQRVAGGETAGRAQALGKWAYWTQLGLRGGDSYDPAGRWAGKVMATDLQSEEAREGIAAWVEKRKPQWKA